MPRFDAIYLSPHPDDAAFSCGGRICLECGAGAAVLIVTVFAGEPAARVSRFARRLARIAGVSGGLVAERRREDAESASILGAQLLQWPLLDAIYRCDPTSGRPLYPSRRALFRERRPDDAGVLASLAALVSELPPHGRLLVPLGVGGHVDHLLVREAAEAHATVCQYWEDFPYAASRPSRVRRLTAGPVPWIGETLELSADAVEARCRAMAAHRSQIHVIFGDASRMRRKLLRHVERIGGERYWQKARQ